MIARFREVDRAIGYLCEGLFCHSQWPFSQVIFYADGKRPKRTMLVPHQHLVNVLHRMCRGFPAATAMVADVGGAAPFGGVQCRCDSHDDRRYCRNHCRHHTDRATACVILCREEVPPSESAWESALATIHQAIADEHAERSGRNRKRPVSRLHKLL